MRISDWSSDVCSSDLSDFTWHGLQIRLRGAYFLRILARSGATRLRSGENLSSHSRIFASTGKAPQAASSLLLAAIISWSPVHKPRLTYRSSRPPRHGLARVFSLGRASSRASVGEYV